jgi:sensor domain CHASE-containing protein
MENNVNGSTSKFGPVTKKLITTSSKDKVNASSHPDMTEGRISGNIILVNIVHSPAPRSLAAFIRFLLKVFKREITIIITNGKLRVMWASNKL